MGVFDWLKRQQGPGPEAWDVRREGAEVVVFDGKQEQRVPTDGAQCVRVVPLAAGPGHGAPSGSGWQVAVRTRQGDLPLGRQIQDGHQARAFARRVCDASGLPLDEMSERLFSGTSHPRQRE